MGERPWEEGQGPGGGGETLGGGGETLGGGEGSGRGCWSGGFGEASHPSPYQNCVFKFMKHRIRKKSTSIEAQLSNL